jgi:hypothetical protein
MTVNTKAKQYKRMLEQPVLVEPNYPSMGFNEKDLKIMEKDFFKYCTQRGIEFEDAQKLVHEIWDDTSIKQVKSSDILYLYYF